MGMIDMSRQTSARFGQKSSSRPTSGAKQLERTSSLARAVAAAGNGINDQLAFLQQKHAELESEQRSSAETMQWTIESNKQTLLALKQEHKDLKQSLSRRAATVAGPGGSGTSARDGAKSAMDKTVEKLEREVHELRRHYDKIMQEKKTTVSKLANLQDNIKHLHNIASSRPGSGGSNDAGGRAARDLRQLQNRLDKATIKCNEAVSIRRTYEQVIDRLKKEQIAIESQIKGLEECLKAKAAEHEHLLITTREAQHAKEQAKQELATYEEKLAKERAQREHAVLELRAQAQLLHKTNQALLQCQYATKGAAAATNAGSGTAAATDSCRSPDAEDAAGNIGIEDCVAIGNTSSQNISTAVADELGAAAAGSAAAAGDAPTAAAGVVRPPLSAAAAIQQLCSATGSSSIPELLQRLLPQQETAANLANMQALAAQQVAEVAEELRLARMHLDDLRSCGRLSTQAQLDSAQEELKEATAKAEAAKALHDQVLRAHVDLRAGLEHLVSMVLVLPLPTHQPSIPVDDDTFAEVIAQCEQRLVSAYKFICSLPKAVQLLDGMITNPDLAFGAV